MSPVFRGGGGKSGGGFGVEDRAEREQRDYSVTKCRQKSPSVFTDASLGAEAAAFLRATQQSCALLEAIR